MNNYVILEKVDESPLAQLKRLTIYQSRRNNWYNQRIEMGESVSLVELERENWKIKFEKYLDKMRRLEVIV